MAKLASQLGNLDVNYHHSPTSLNATRPEPKAPSKKIKIKPLIMFIIGIFLFLIGILATILGFILSIGYSLWPANLIWPIGILFSLLGFMLALLGTFWLCHKGSSNGFLSDSDSDDSVKSALPGRYKRAIKIVGNWQVSPEFVPSRAGSLTTSGIFPASNTSNLTSIKIQNKK